LRKVQCAAAPDSREQVTRNTSHPAVEGYL
jgi:hypothetical protein